MFFSFCLTCLASDALFCIVFEDQPSTFLGESTYQLGAEPHASEWYRLIDFKSFGSDPSWRNTCNCLQKKLLSSWTQFTVMISHLLQDSRFWFCEYSQFIFMSLLNIHERQYYDLVLLYSKGTFFPSSSFFLCCSNKVFCKVLM